MLSTFTVTNTSDSGAGGLRQAIISSDGVSGPARINFNIPGGGVQTINLLSALPAITRPVVLDGTTEPDSFGGPVIQVDGTNAGSTAVGLTLTAAASGSTIKGLAITDFSGGGLLVSGAANVSLAIDDIGLVMNIIGGAAHGNYGFGVELASGANHDLLSGDVISGQNGVGVVLTGSTTKITRSKARISAQTPSARAVLGTSSAW